MGAARENGTLTDDEATWLENARAAEEALIDTRARVDPVTGEPLVAQLYLYDPPPSTATAGSPSRPATSTPPTT